MPMFTSLYSCRRIRRAAHEALTKRVVQGYHPIQTKEATILVSSLLTPSVSFNPDKQFQRLSASTIMSILYDYPTIVSEHDHTLEKIDAYNLRISKAENTGSRLVDIFPWMIHIPERSWLLFYSLVLYTDARPNKICEMEAGRLTTIHRGLCHVQGSSKPCSS
jgi:hypothetical protein